MEITIDTLFYFFAALGGLALSLLLDVNSSGIKANEFDLAKWWNDNGIRLITSVAALALAITFSDAIWPILIGSKITIQQAILTGLSSDQIVNMFDRRRKNKEAKKEAENNNITPPKN